MPITIKELHIKINVDEKSESQGKTSGSKNGNTAAIVSACVEEVMDILERQNNDNESRRVKKLVIKAYSDDKFKDEVANGEFTTLVNPEKYMIAYKPEYTEEQGQGTSGSQPKFTRIPPQELDLDLLFDSSGAIDGKSDLKDGIIDKIEAFKKIVFEYKGEEHKPNYLMIKWGALLFKGSLVDLSIEYKLFAPDGTPLRASAKLKVKGTVDDDLRVARENNQSPDLTHYRKVKSGDTLPLMCHRIYGDSKYYLEVARVNKIMQFRKLQPGQEIFFPPLQKIRINE